LKSNAIQRLDKAPRIAQMKKTLEGENLSAMDSRAKIRVPEIKPNCTAEVRFPSASLSS
jgi:hypothetical protein